MLIATLVLLHVLQPAGAPPAGDVDHPITRRVVRFREARRTDPEAARALVSPGARIWFQTREGPGSPLDATGSGPWAPWDRHFRSRSTMERADVSGRDVRIVVQEINDWYRLVERPPSRYHITYTFDESDRIHAVLIHAIPGEPRRADRLAEFETWARENHPGLLAELMPEGNIDPRRAAQFKRALLAWRAESGLPNPLEPDGP